MEMTVKVGGVLNVSKQLRHRFMLGNPDSGIREIFLVRFPRNINVWGTSTGRNSILLTRQYTQIWVVPSDWLVKQFASTNQRHPNLGSGTSSGFPQVARDFSKSCSKVAKIKSNLLFESKVAQKNKNLFLLLSPLIWSNAKVCKFYNKSTKFFKHSVQFWSVTSVAQ